MHKVERVFRTGAYVTTFFSMPTPSGTKKLLSAGNWAGGKARTEETSGATKVAAFRNMADVGLIETTPAAYTAESAKRTQTALSILGCVHATRQGASLLRGVGSPDSSYEGSAAARTTHPQTGCTEYDTLQTQRQAPHAWRVTRDRWRAGRQGGLVLGVPADAL